MFKMPPRDVLKEKRCSVSKCNNLTNYYEPRGPYVSIGLCKKHRK